VAMHDMRGVRGVESLERVLDDRRDLGEREVLLATKPLVETLADETLERDPESTVLLFSRSEDGRDERRLDLLGDVGLAIEARDEIGVLRRALMEDLERDLLSAASFRCV